MREKGQTRKQITWVNVSQLLLDDNNFRLSEDARGVSQKELLRILDRDFDPLTIGQSLTDNGYFVEEPLVVIPKPPGDKYVVVEGNRRLAALKFLLEKELRSLTQNPSAWDALAKRLTRELSQVPVVIYESRDELTTVLGFRHIAGIMKWDPLAKARFIADLVDRRGEKANFAEIAREIGSRSDHIRNQYIVYRAYLQAKDLQIDTSRLEKNFAVFYRAITGTRPIGQFIGLSKDKSPKELRKPVPPKKADALEELIGYIHGTASVKPVIRDSRELTQLGEVLAGKAALENLKLTRNLQRALELVGGETKRLLDNLTSASYYLDESLKDVHRHREDPKVTDVVRRCVQTIVEIVKHFPEMQRELESRR